MARIYACGGTGINQMSKVPRNDKLAVTYADCSDSDIDFNLANIKESEVFLFKNISKGGASKEVNGSGKRREENFEIIEPQITKFLELHPPHKVNIVASSDCGGSGAVIAHLLAERLIATGHAVILLLTNSVNSLKEASNSFKALRGFNEMAVKHQVGLPIVYASNNTEGSSPSAVDNLMRKVAAELTELTTKKYHSLDPEDLVNFFLPHRVSKLKGALVELMCRTGDVKLKEGTQIISTLSLVPSIDDMLTSVPSEYATHGIDNDSDTSKHFLLSTSHVGDKVGFVHSHLLRLENEAKAREQAAADPFAGLSFDGESKNGCYM